MDTKNKKTEYNRNYYYKRDPEKLAKYRKKYQRKQHEKKLQEKWRRAHGVKPRVKKTIADATTPRQKSYYKNYEKVRERARNHYLKNREKILGDMNSKYREKKLKEFVDSIITNIGLEKEREANKINYKKFSL